MRPVFAVIGAGVAVAALPAPVRAHGVGQGPPPTDLVGIATAWHLDVPLMLALAAAGAAYLAAVRSVNGSHPRNRWSRGRTAAFLSALGAVGIALLSPIDTLSDDLLTVHMIQHLLLVSVAAPLLAVSGLGTLALRAASPTTRKRYLLPFLHSRFVSALTLPVVGWVAFAGVMWGSHVTSLYNLALLDDGIHAVEHALYLSAAALFWWPLLSPDPLPRRLHPGIKLVALIAQIPPMSFLAITIISATTPLYSAYLGRTDAFGIDALLDQRMAGSLMWVTGDLALVLPLAVLLMRLVRHDEEEAKRIDARLDRERQLLRKGS